jgi:tetratricopeptide (TPR) repeat protein
MSSNKEVFAEVGQTSCVVTIGGYETGSRQETKTDCSPAEESPVDGSDTTNEQSEMKPVGGAEINSSSLMHEIDLSEYVKHWEQDALSHFKNSSWKDVIQACEKVLEVPGQSETNFDVLFEMGYAHMKRHDYRNAIAYFKVAHGIDSKRVPLKLALIDLRTRMRSGSWRKRCREVSNEQQKQLSSKKPLYELRK